VLWAPDYLVSAGGIINAVAREQDGLSTQEAVDRVRGIGGTLRTVLQRAATDGTAPHQVALRLAAERLGAARQASCRSPHNEGVAR
jgi:leucine dehydrogenase